MAHDLSDTVPPRGAPSVGGIQLNAGIYAVLMLLSAGLIGLRLLDTERDEMALVLCLIVVVMLVVRMWLVGAVYFASLAYLFLDENHWGRSVGFFSSEEWLFAVATVVFLISSCRYLCLTSPILPYGSNSFSQTIAETRGFVSSILSSETTEAYKQTIPDARLEARPAHAIQPAEFLTAFFRIVLALLGAAVILVQFPFGDLAAPRREFGLLATAFRPISIAWVLIGITLLLGLVLTPVRWLRHSPREAGVYLRSTVTCWCFRDLRSMVRRVVKARRNSLVTRLRRGARSEPAELLDANGAVVKTAEDLAGSTNPPNLPSALLQQRKK